MIACGSNGPKIIHITDAARGSTASHALMDGCMKKKKRTVTAQPWLAQLAVFTV